MTLGTFVTNCSECDGYICIQGKEYFDGDYDYEILWDSKVNTNNNLPYIPRNLFNAQIEDFSFGLSGDGYPRLNIFLDVDVEDYL